MKSRGSVGRVVVVRLAVRRVGGQGRAVGTRAAWVSVLLVARPVAPMAVVGDGAAVASASLAWAAVGMAVASAVAR